MSMFDAFNDTFDRLAHEDTTSFYRVSNESELAGISATWIRELTFYVSGVLTTVITGLGLVGNLLAVIVLTKPTMHTSTNCYLTALVAWDSVVLLMSLLLMALSEVTCSFKRLGQPYVIVYLYPLALVAQTATLWLTVSFTVERYIAVCHPLQAAPMCTVSRARIVVAAVAFISLIYNVPRWFEYRLTQVRKRNCKPQCCINESNVYTIRQLNAFSRQKQVSTGQGARLNIRLKNIRDKNQFQ